MILLPLALLSARKSDRGATFPFHTTPSMSKIAHMQLDEQRRRERVRSDALALGSFGHPTSHESLQKLSKKYKLPLGAVRNLVVRALKNNSSLDQRRLLSAASRKKLLGRAVRSAANHRSISRSALGRLVAQAAGKGSKFNVSNAGKAFLDSTAEYVAYRKCRRTDDARIAPQTYDPFPSWLKLATALVKFVGEDPARIFNVDESTITVYPNEENMLLVSTKERGKHNQLTPKVTNLGSVCAFVGASGDAVYFAVCWKGKVDLVASKQMESVLLRSRIVVVPTHGAGSHRLPQVDHFASSSGFFDRQTFKRAMGDANTGFVKELNLRRHSAGLDVLLFMDNCACHPTEADANVYEKVNHVNIVWLPPNTTHFTAPLDNAMFGALKTSHRRIKSELTAKGLSPEDAQRVGFVLAMERALVPHVIKRGFAATGICPWRPELILANAVRNANVKIVPSGQKRILEQVETDSVSLGQTLTGANWDDLDLIDVVTSPRQAIMAHSAQLNTATASKTAKVVETKAEMKKRTDADARKSKATIKQLRLEVAALRKAAVVGPRGEAPAIPDEDANSEIAEMASEAEEEEEPAAGAVRSGRGTVSPLAQGSKPAAEGKSHRAPGRTRPPAGLRKSAAKRNASNKVGRK